MASKIYNNYLPEIAALKFRRKRPAAVSLNLNADCDQHCIYCEIGHGKPSNSRSKLNIKDVEWLIEQMAIENIHRLALNGGEPFLSGNIIKVVEMAGEKGIRCSISSNGMSIHKLNDRHLETLKNYRTRINISIDSFDPEINDMTRGKQGALANAIRSIEKVNKYEIELSLLCVISKHNYRSLFDHVRASEEKGIKEVLFQPVIFYSNFPDRKAIVNKSSINVDPGNTDVLQEELNKILAFEHKHRIKTNAYRIRPWIVEYIRSIHSDNGHFFFNRILNHFYCRELDSIIEINYDGGLLPCGLGEAKYNIQDIRDEGLIGGWNKARAELKNHIKKQEFHPMCNACCHHFSRNMIASVIRYPYKNRRALSLLVPALLARFNHNLYKAIFLK